MKTIGILAYGSLIRDPGVEISPHVRKRISDVTTPFPIEFARKSGTRDGAPTLIPHKDGATVSAVILLLDTGVTREEAVDMLWRRETRNEGTRKSYERPENPSRNKVLVESIEEFAGVDEVLYTKIGCNIEDLNAEVLAELAIQSAEGTVAEPGNDGISYLISAKAHGIDTPMTGEYESAILRKTGAASLKEAVSQLRGRE